jgi:hypothetical protein
VSQAARVVTDNDGIADDGEVIDFRLARARRMLLAATFNLQEMLVRLNARPGAGINFALIFEIGRAERTVDEARAKLRCIEASAKE